FFPSFSPFARSAVAAWKIRERPGILLPGPPALCRRRHAEHVRQRARVYPCGRKRPCLMASSLPVINLSEAKFECIYGRGCDGICCRNGRPGVYPEEEQRIEANLGKFLPQLRPEARALIEKSGFLSRRRKHGLPMLRVIDSWCVFFHEGCVLHKVGAMAGDKYR